MKFLLTSANTDHAANEALLTTIDADTNDIKTSTAACATDLAALEVLQTSTNSKLDHLSANQDTLETTLTAIETDAAAIEVLLTAANTDHAANEVLLTNAEAHLGNIETAVQALDDIALAEDAAHSSGQKGVMFLGVRQSSQADFAADGDYTPLSIDDDGKLRVTGSAASGGSTEAKQDTVIGHLDGVEGKLDTLETTLTAIETDIAANEVLHTAANALLTTIDSDTDAIKTSTAACATDLAAIEVLQTAANTDLAAIEVLLTAANVDHAANEALLITIDADTNDIKTNTAACATDLAALEVLQTAANTDLAAIEVLQTAANTDLAAIEVLLTSALSKGEAMEYDTIMSAVSIGAGANANSDTYTKPRGIKDFAIAIVAATAGTYNAFVEYSVDDSTYFRGSNLNMGSTLTNTVAVGGATISAGYRYYRVNIVNNHGGSQNFTIRISY